MAWASHADPGRMQSPCRTGSCVAPLPAQHGDPPQCPAALWVSVSAVSHSLALFVGNIQHSPFCTAGILGLTACASIGEHLWQCPFPCTQPRTSPLWAVLAEGSSRHISQHISQHTACPALQLGAVLDRAAARHDVSSTVVSLSPASLGASCALALALARPPCLRAFFYSTIPQGFLFNCFFFSLLFFPSFIPYPAALSSLFPVSPFLSSLLLPAPQRPPGASSPH